MSLSKDKYYIFDNNSVKFLGKINGINQWSENSDIYYYIDIYAKFSGKIINDWISIPISVIEQDYDVEEVDIEFYGKYII